MLCTNIVLNVKTKAKNQFLYTTRSEFIFSGNSMNSLLSYCGLTDARVRASEKDLPVTQLLRLRLLIWFLFLFIADTIYTTAGIMLFIHLVFHNYGLERAAVVSNALSLNASLFASVCLASRLASSYDAFVLLTFSVVAFVLFPIFRFRLNGMTLLSVALISVPCSILLAAKCYTSSFAAFAALGFIIVIGICPGLFVRWQNFKDTIHHPQWDEAVPNISFFK